ncbi:MAG: adenylate/guanylate cyclase domain-containing protein [Anaerolineales bacterium]
MIAGVIGSRKFVYDVWGDAVNVASRMESHGASGTIQITQATHELIKDQFVCEPRGTVNVKGKGEMEVWLVKSARE